MEENPPTPSWMQSTSTHRRALRRRHGDSPSIFLKSGFLVLILVLAAMLLFLFLVIPPVVNLSRQILRPNSVKTSWDFINLVLVIFAIVCGFLRRKSEDEASSSADLAHRRQGQVVLQPSTSSLKRSSSSYPDLRRGAPWIVKGDGFRSYDDMYLDDYEYDQRLMSLNHDLSQHNRSWEGEDEEVHVDSILSRLQARATATGSLPALLARPEPRSQTYSSPKLMHRSPPSNRSKARQEYGTVLGYADRPGTWYGTVWNGTSSSPKEEEEDERKMHQPPPPPSSISHPAKSGTKSTPGTTSTPILLTNSNSFNSISDNSSIGSNSPLIQTPPPPPFKVPSWKFVVQDDYIRLAEITSTTDSPHSDYPDGEEGNETASSSSQGTGSPTLFCPSPDVNIKADDFIARFRSKLKLERMDSIKLMQRNSLSPLGQDSSQSPVSTRL